jgi:hypothetical protein
MGTPWVTEVRGTHQLTFFLNAVAGAWLAPVESAVREFNALSRQHGLGVRYVPSTEPPTDSGGANIAIATANGSVSFGYRGGHSTTLEGRALSGRTFLAPAGGAPIEKGFIFLPQQPMVFTPRGLRPTGAGVMMVIAVHELIHGCGLFDEDHTPIDVFNGFPDYVCGPTPAEDKIHFLAGGRDQFLPPILFSGETARKVRQLWG